MKLNLGGGEEESKLAERPFAGGQPISVDRLLPPFPPLS
jgi:hypothetical protein